MGRDERATTGRDESRSDRDEPSRAASEESGAGGDRLGGPPERASVDDGTGPARSSTASTGPSTPYTDEDPDPTDGVGAAIAWFSQTDSEWVALLRETIVSILIVLAVGLMLFVISGVWPPLVAVESNSMDPHLQKGDLVLVMDESRLSPDAAAGDTGIVTVERGIEADYNRFGGPGDVIVYQPDGSAAATPIIHRAHLYVEEGENWYDRTDPDFVHASSCLELTACPAPTDGFITKGDNARTNNYYDQTRGISTVVEPEWVRGRAVLRIPWVGWIRLAASDLDILGLATVDGPSPWLYTPGSSPLFA